MTIDETQLDPPGEIPNEWNVSERPLLIQLMMMDWDYLKGDTDVPELTFRDDFKQVILKDMIFKKKI